MLTDLLQIIKFDCELNSIVDTNMVSNRRKERQYRRLLSQMDEISSNFVCGNITQGGATEAEAIGFGNINFINDFENERCVKITRHNEVIEIGCCRQN